MRHSFEPQHLLPTLALALLGPLQPAPRAAQGPEADPVRQDAAAATDGAPLAIVGGTVHSMQPGVAPARATVLVVGDRIAAVGPDVAVPEGARVLDAAGRHVLPGLVDAMVGFDPDHDALYLRSGVTLVRDLGSARVKTIALRDREVRDAAPGPTLQTPGAPLDGDPPSTPEAAILRDPSAAELLLPIVLADEPDYLAVLRGLSPEVHALVGEVAAESGLEVWGPKPVAISLQRALVQGQRGYFFLDSLLPPGREWSDVDEDEVERLAALLGAYDALLVPAVEASALRLVDPLAVPGGREMLALLAPSYAVWWTREAEARVPLLDEAVVARGKAQRERSDSMLRSAHAAGVQLVPGTGAPNPWLFPGSSLHAELERWVEAGLDRETVLDLATRGAAAALGLGESHGVVAAGRVADLLVVAGDPRVDLGVLADPEAVVLRGRLLPRAELEAGVQAVLEARAAERAVANQPIEVEPPPHTEGARTVLSGYVENWAVGQRVGAERFLVERLENGTLRYVGQLVEPARGDAPARRMIVRQDVREGALVEFSVTATDGVDELALEGVWAAETLRLRRLVNGVSDGGVSSSGQRVVALDAGSVTSYLILARRPREGVFPVLTFHEALTPEIVNWRLEIDPGGDFQMGTPLGPLAFRLDERGAPTRSRRIVGRGALDGRLLEADTRGGPGHPLPAETAAWVAEQAAAARARAEAEAPAPEDEPDGDGSGAGGGGG